MSSTDEKLSTAEAARHLGLAPATLAKMRCWGGSPPFLRLGRKVVYCRDDLDAWLNARRATSTSDADRLPRRLTIRDTADRLPSELPSGRDGAKDAARSETIQCWPAKAAFLARAKDDDRAEAALIAAVGLLREGKQ